MEIVRIQGIDYMVDQQKEPLSPLLDKMLILEDPVPLFRFIDSAGFDGSTIYRAKIAQEIKFNFDTFLKRKATGEIILKPKRLSELVENLDGNDLQSYQFVLATDNKEMLSEVIQQLFYLGINIEVMLQNEEGNIRKMDTLIRLFDKLSSALQEAKTHIADKGRNDEMREYSERALSALSSIEESLRAIDEMNLKVSIMALKKSGKSVFVNCFLGAEYSPASIELPTYTTCIYKKSNDNRISLHYKNRDLYFNAPSELKNHILNEFKSIHIGSQQHDIPDDMYINYLPSKGKHYSYTIIDTPGPDLAGTRHKEIVYRWIRESDVILFIIDYSKHLTSTEEEFLHSIKQVFEEFNKFYSFIVVVNKLDLMYLSEEKKSSIRFIDFLRSKLKDLGYRSIIIFGVSALQYYYSSIASQIKGCEQLDCTDGKKFREYLDECLRHYQGKDEMTVLSFIDTQIRNQQWFHSKADATLREIKEKSGIEHLMNYINQIAMEKAYVEFFNHKIMFADQKLRGLQQNLFYETTGQLAKKLSEFDKTIGNIYDFINQTETYLKRESNIADVHNKIEHDFQLIYKSLSVILDIQASHIIEQLGKILKAMTTTEMVSFYKGTNLGAIEKVFTKIEHDKIEKLYAPLLKRYWEDINKKIRDKEWQLKEQQKAMQLKVHELNAQHDRRYKLPEFEIALPRLSSTFNKFDFSPIVMKLDNSFTQSLIKERQVRQRGIIGTLVLISTFGLIKIKTGSYRFNERKIKKAAHVARKSLEDDTHQQITSMHMNLLAHINQHIDLLNTDLTETMDRFLREWKDLFFQFAHDLEASKAKTELKIKFLEEARESLQRFSYLWQKV